MPTFALLIALGCPPSGAALYAPHIAYLAPRLGIETDQASAVLVRLQLTLALVGEAERPGRC